MFDTDAQDGFELSKEGLSDVGEALKAPVKLIYGVSKIITGPIVDAIDYFKKK